MTMADNEELPRSDGRSPLGYWPSGGPWFILLLALFVLAITFINLVGYVYERVGLSPGWLMAVLVGCLLGSRVNIPIWRFHGTAGAPPRRWSYSVSATGSRPAKTAARWSSLSMSAGRWSRQEFLCTSCSTTGFGSIR